MGMSQEHAAAAAIHAAKMAQFNAINHHGLDKITPNLLAPQFDLSKIAQNNNHNDMLSRLSAANNYVNSNSGLTIEPIMRRDHGNSSTSENGPISMSTLTATGTTITPTTTTNSSEIHRDSAEPMDLGLDNNQSGSNNDGGQSDCDDNYSEDEGVHNT